MVSVRGRAMNNSLPSLEFHQNVAWDASCTLEPLNGCIEFVTCTMEGREEEEGLFEDRA